jgi:hypothetical protein
VDDSEERRHPADHRRACWHGECKPRKDMIERYSSPRTSRRARLVGMIRRLEERMRRHRELVWHPRLEFSAARQMSVTNRQLEVLRRRMR